jgi:hypothetical protein
VICYGFGLEKEVPKNIFVRFAFFLSPTISGV